MTQRTSDSMGRCSIRRGERARRALAWTVVIASVVRGRVPSSSPARYTGGWTTEADFLEGQRTEPAELAELVSGSSSV